MKAAADRERQASDEKQQLTRKGRDRQMIAEIIKDKEYKDHHSFLDGKPIWIERKGGILEITAHYGGAYGMGEKFDFLNQKGQTVVNQVVEKFCNQGNISYCVTPFFMTDAGFGIYVETKEKTVFSFQEKICCEIPESAAVYVFLGSMQEILSDYIDLLGRPKLPPPYAFGVWISANRWNCEEDVEEQLACLKKYRFPASVLVLEAWSDEATFYIWNGAQYEAKHGRARYEDYDFTASKYWQDPKGMLDKLHEEGIRLVLWQIPVWKKQGEEEEPSSQLALDAEYAVQNRLCVMRQGGTPYEIPEGNWFAGSLIPDFTKEETRRFWFEKRRYLLEMGVDGFKTDGGEFIYQEDILFGDGTTGREGKNQYCQDYLDAYTDFIREDHVLFSRAGYAGAHRTPIHWAGDHQSTNEEFRSILTAGLSAAMSGMAFWSFDIGGFAGALPDPDLYLRSTQMACFSPIMQWHSEPEGGQFKELMPGIAGNNERSPWNMARVYGKPEFMDELRYWHELRMEILPYLYETAREAVEDNKPMMRPLIYSFQEDENCLHVEDEYMLGQKLLVAPLMEQGQKTREVYFPEGNWYGFFTGQKYTGKSRKQSHEEEKFPVYVKEGSAVIRECGEKVRIYLYGEQGCDTVYYKQKEHQVVWNSRERQRKTEEMKGGIGKEIEWITFP